MTEIERRIAEFLSSGFWAGLAGLAAAVVFAHMIGFEWSRLFILVNLYEALKPNVLRERQMREEGSLTRPRLERMAKVLERMLARDRVLLPPPAPPQPSGPPAEAKGPPA
jgi:hypothetical protein